MELLFLQLFNHNIPCKFKYVINIQIYFKLYIMITLNFNLNINHLYFIEFCYHIDNITSIGGSFVVH